MLVMILMRRNLDKLTNNNGVADMMRTVSKVIEWTHSTFTHCNLNPTCNRAYIFVENKKKTFYSCHVELDAFATTTTIKTDDEKLIESWANILVSLHLMMLMMSGFWIIYGFYRISNGLMHFQFVCILLPNT